MVSRVVVRGQDRAALVVAIIAVALEGGGKRFAGNWEQAWEDLHFMMC